MQSQVFTGEAARILGRHRSVVADMVHEGKLTPAGTIGTYWIWDRDYLLQTRADWDRAALTP